MADKTDDLIISISTDLATVRRSMKKLEADIAATSGNVVKKFEDMGKGIDKSMVTAMQVRIDQMTGVGARAAKEWNGVLSQQGAELDKLRQKYNPVFAAVNSYKASVVEIQRAQRLGAISSDEMTAAIQRERKATLDSIAAIKGRNTALAQKPVKDPVNQFNTANLAAQFQDIAVTTAMGMSPLQIALQQGTQISAVLGPMGAAGAVKSLGAAFLSVVSPVSLATIGLVAGTAAAIQFFTSSKEGAKTVDAILKQHEDNIKRLGPAYEDALRQQKKYVSESPELIASDMKDNFKEAIEKRVTDARSAIESIYSAMTREKLAGVTMGGVADALPSRFEAATKAIQAFEASIKAGKPNVDAFQRAILNLEKAGTITPDVFSELKNFTKDAKATEVALSGVSETYDTVAHAMANVAAKIDSISSAKARKEIEGLWEKVKNGDSAVSTLINAINRLSLTNPDLSNAKNELQSFIDLALQAQSVSAGGARTTPKSGRLAPLSDANFNMRFDNPYDKLREELAAKNKELNKTPKVKKDRGAERDANAYRDLVKSAQDRIDQMQLEEQLIGKTGVAAEALRMRLELLQRAEDKGREISAAQRAELEAKAASYGKLAERVAALSAAEELRFEREQMFRSSTEQRVASQLRSIGLSENSGPGKYLADQIRLNEKLAEGRDIAMDFASGFTQDLLNGVSAMEALGNAASRLGQKLLDMALDQAINSLFGNLLGSLGGGAGGGSLMSRYGGLTGMFAEGTNYAPGGMALVGEKGPELVNLPRGSQVIPNHKLGSVIEPRVPSLVASNNNGGGLNFAPVYHIDARGADQAAVERLQRGLETTNREMESRVVQTVRKAQKSNWKF